MTFSQKAFDNHNPISRFGVHQEDTTLITVTFIHLKFNLLCFFPTCVLLGRCLFVSKTFPSILKFPSLKPYLKANLWWFPSPHPAGGVLNPRPGNATKAKHILVQGRGRGREGPRGDAGVVGLLGGGGAFGVGWKPYLLSLNW